VTGPNTSRSGWLAASVATVVLFVAIAIGPLGFGESSGEPTAVPRTAPEPPTRRASTIDRSPGVRQPADSQKSVSPLPGAVDVQVVWQAGAGVEGVEVDLGYPTDHARWPLRATTDADGIARFTAVPAGRVAVTLDRDDELTVHDVPAARTLRIVRELSTSSRLRGRVVDAVAAPVKGATLWLSRTANHEVGARVATTAADGTFQIIGVKGWRYLWAAAPRLARTFPRRVDPSVDEEIVIVLEEPGYVVRGLVLDAAGAPVAAVAVRLEPPARPSPTDATGVSLPPRPSETGRTASDGTFSFEGVPGGRGLVRLAPDDGPRVHQVFEVGPDDFDTTIRFGATGSLDGRVVDTDGRPVAGAVVGVGREQVDPFFVRIARTDLEGRFQLDGLAPGRHPCWVAFDGRIARTDCRIVPGARASASVTLPPESDSVVEVEVRNPAGVVVEGARVELSLDARRRGWSKRTVSDGAGLARFHGVPDAALRVSVALPAISDYPVAWVSLPGIPSRRVVVRIEAAAVGAGTVRVRVVDPAGAPLAGCRVILRSTRLSTNPTASTGTEGGAEFERIPLGDYRLEVRARGADPVVVGTLRVAADAVSDAGTVIVRGAK
jgi:protocatechuate 3,4-dioxygenase beta subunit